MNLQRGWCVASIDPSRTDIATAIEQFEIAGLEVARVRRFGHASEGVLVLLRRPRGPGRDRPTTRID